MKYLIILMLFASISFGQVIHINKTDSDSLWYDFNFMYSELTKDKFSITIEENDYIIFHSKPIRFACSWSDIEPRVLKKIKKRMKLHKNYKP